MSIAEIESDLLEARIEIGFSAKSLSALQVENQRLIKAQEEFTSGRKKASEHLAVLRSSRVTIASEFKLIVSFLKSFVEKISETEIALERNFTAIAVRKSEIESLRKEEAVLQGKLASYNGILEFPVDTRRSQEED